MQDDQACQNGLKTLWIILHVKNLTKYGNRFEIPTLDQNNRKSVEILGKLSTRKLFISMKTVRKRFYHLQHEFYRSLKVRQSNQ